MSSFRLLCSRGMLGTFTTSIRHQEKLDLLLLLLAAYSSPTTATDLMPQDTYGLQLRCAADDAGQLELGELCESWRTCPAGDAGQLGEHLEPEHIVPFAAGLGAKAVAHYDWGLAAANVALQLLHTHGGRSAATVGSVGRCWWTHECMSEAVTAASFYSQHLSNPVRVHCHGIGWQSVLRCTGILFLLVRG